MPRFNQKKFQEWVDNNFLMVTEKIGKYFLDCYYSKVDKCYIPNDYLKELFKLGITDQIQGKSRKSKACSIGFNPTEKKWYGFSHRAICGFKIGDRAREVYPGETKLGKKLKTLEECKQAAKDFAESVS